VLIDEVAEKLHLCLSHLILSKADPESMATKDLQDDTNMFFVFHR